jgi:hypothetical protein
MLTLLPNELIGQIFLWCDAKTLGNLRKTCKLFNNLGNDPSIYYQWVKNQYYKQITFQRLPCRYGNPVNYDICFKDQPWIYHLQPFYSPVEKFIHQLNPTVSEDVIYFLYLKIIRCISDIEDALPHILTWTDVDEYRGYNQQNKEYAGNTILTVCTEIIDDPIWFEKIGRCWFEQPHPYSSIVMFYHQHIPTLYDKRLMQSFREVQLRFEDVKYSWYLTDVLNSFFVSMIYTYELEDGKNMYNGPYIRGGCENHN